jgi:hypothetical protein
MECLEARVVPTTIFVNSLEPHDFFRAVREAHRNDQDGELHDQIVLTQAGTIRLPQEVFIDTDIEIVGLGAGTTILQGRGSGRLFHIEDVGGAVEFRGLTITGGKTTDEWQQGGAIFNGGADLTFRDVHVVGNSTEGRLAAGGAVFSEGDVFVFDSVFSNNSTSGPLSPGGAIAVDLTVGGARLEMHRVEFIENEATGDDSGGGAVYVADGELVATDIAAVRNSTGSLGAAVGNTSPGGAFQVVRSPVTLTASEFIGNATHGVGSPGGAISIADSSAVIAQVLVLQNRTAGDQSEGGGISTVRADSTLQDVLIQENVTLGYRSGGGGASFDYGDTTLLNVSVYQNQTFGLSSPGGGIKAEIGNQLGIFNGELTVEASEIVGNATHGDLSMGGGIYVDKGTLKLIDTRVILNSTDGEWSGGGGVMADKSILETSGSTVIKGNGTSHEDAPGDNLRLKDSDFNDAFYEDYEGFVR